MQSFNGVVDVSFLYTRIFVVGVTNSEQLCEDRYIIISKPMKKVNPEIQNGLVYR